MLEEKALDNPIENQVNFEAKLEKASEPLEIGSLKPEAIILTAILENDVLSNLKEGGLRNPDVIEQDLLKVQQEMHANRRNPYVDSHEEYALRNRHAYLINESENTQISISLIRDYLERSNTTRPDVTSLSDEQVLLEFEYSLDKTYGELQQAILITQDGIPEKIDRLRQLIDLIPDSRVYISMAKEALDQLKAGNVGKYMMPPIGEGMRDFIISGNTVEPISSVSPNSVVYLPEIGTIGAVTGDETRDLAIVVDQERKKGFTGLGSLLALRIVLNNVEGKCIPINFYDGVPETLDERNKIYDGIMQSIIDKGIKTVETHSFDPAFLPDALFEGHFTIPHLKGFQVESRSLTSKEIPTLEYISRDNPYYFFILNGDLLSERYPTSDPKNRFNGFHFIPDGLDISDEAIMAIVVPEGMREKFINWIKSMPEDKRTKILGDKELEHLLISQADHLYS